MCPLGHMEALHMLLGAVDIRDTCLQRSSRKFHHEWDFTRGKSFIGNPGDKLEELFALSRQAVCELHRSPHLPYPARRLPGRMPSERGLSSLTVSPRTAIEKAHKIRNPPLRKTKWQPHDSK
jgi:hypothetical protein